MFLAKFMRPVAVPCPFVVTVDAVRAPRILTH
jgi:hypothetical protein